MTMGEKPEGILIDGGATTDYTWCLFAKFSPWYLPKASICQVFTFGQKNSLDSNFCAKMPVCQVFIKIAIFVGLVFNFFDIFSGRFCLF